MTNSQGGVYQIRHVASGRIYVGSAVSIRIRWRGHRFHLNRGTHHSRHLQNAWKKHGPDAFIFEVLQVVELAEDTSENKTRLLRAEQEWLDRLRPYDRGVGYNNSPTAGSILGYKHTPETRAKVSEAKRNQSPETRAKLAAAKRGRVVSEETKAKMSAIFRNRSPEIRAKISAGLKRRPPEIIAKIAAANLGRKATAEARANMSASRAGKKISEEHREKLLNGRRASRRRRPGNGEDQHSFKFSD